MTDATTDINRNKHLGFKAGIEIHQRLDTHKLCCHCPSREGKQAELLVKRRQHAVRGELGEMDRAAAFEFGREGKFAYQYFPDSCCEVDLDESPPFPLNREALKIALEVALHLHAKPIDEIQVMRKTVIDGSNPSGFQRTAACAMDGELETSRGKVRIPLICLEEESCGIVGEEGEEKVYRLDRLGIPLIEVNTEPDMVDPEHLREVAEKIGTLLRVTGKVQRGLGTIRQDVNISIDGGARVEIKGAQDLNMLASWAENEVKRQEALLALIKEVKARCGEKVETGGIIDVSQVFAKTGSKLLAGSLGRGESIQGMAVRKHAGLLGRELLPGRRYGTELSEYAKKAGVKGIIHSDEDMEKYNISGEEVGQVKRLLAVQEGDAFVLVAAPQRIGRKALENVQGRLQMLYVPEETRKALPNGQTEYLRPLASGARLYPETDIPPIRMTAELLAEVKAARGESPEEKRAKLAGLLNPELARKIFKSRNLPLFERLVAQGAEPLLAATTLEETLVSLRREGVSVENAGEEKLGEIFAAYNEGSFVKAAMLEILRLVAKEPGRSIKEIVAQAGLGKITGPALDKLIAEEGADLGKIMQKYRLRVDAAEVKEKILGR